MRDGETLAALRARIKAGGLDEGAAWPAVGLDAGADTQEAVLPGGLASGALHELQPATPADIGAATGFALGLASRLLAQRPGPLLWGLPSTRGWREGQLYPVGLAAFGIDPDRVVQVEVKKTADLLWSLEEALDHPSLAVVVGLLPEGDRLYDFTASRRLAMRAARHGATVLLLGAAPVFDMATAASTRWSLAALASRPVPHVGQAVPGLGPPRWQARLVKSRKGLLDAWDLEWNHETLSFRLAAPLADRAPLRRTGTLARRPTAA